MKIRVRLLSIKIRLSLTVGIEDIYVQLQRENARQEWSWTSQLGAPTTGIDPSKLSVPSGFVSSEVGMFKCTDCQAKPFQTQDMLDFHAYLVHSKVYYCPVQECPRSKPGQGFRKKNEMIRHGLVHESPGYRCPFCPTTIKHRYPRPDNLRRYVSPSSSVTSRVTRYLGHLTDGSFTSSLSLSFFSVPSFVPGW